MRRKISAYITLVDPSASQTPLVSVGLGLLCSYEVATLQVSPSIGKLIFAFAGMILVISHVMVLNDYFDVEIDKKKGVRHALAEIPRRLAGALPVIFLSLGLMFAWVASPTYFAICLVLALLSAAYSAPPIRYKEVYLFSTLGDVSGAFLLFLAGYSLFAPVVNVRAIVISLIPWFVFVVWRLKHEIRFVKFDTKTGKKTLAVVHGVNRVKLLIRLCTLLIIALSIGLLLAGWFSPTFLVFLVIPLSLLALVSASSRALSLWLRIKGNLYWGFVYFFIVVAWILYS